MRRFSLPAIAFATCATFSLSARADDKDVGFFSAETFASYMRMQSPMPLNGKNVPRPIVGFGVPAGSVPLYGVGAALEARNRWLTYRPFEFRYSTTSEGIAGSGTIGDATVLARTTPIQVLEFGTTMPFPGVQVVSSQFKASFHLVFGISKTTTNAIVSGPGALSGGGSITQTDGFVRADLSACTRMGRSRVEGLISPWACLTAEPYLYARDWFPGGALALRVEL